MKILVLNGPNLDLLGSREPEVYGALTLPELDGLCREWGAAHDALVVCRQSNHEGQLIDWLHGAHEEGAAAVVLNAGGYTHTSVALRDAVAAIVVPVVEVHLSNVHARERFRRRSLIAPVCAGTISGLGAAGYRAAIEVLARDLPAG
jgi:3-dehydroquinate dehydratase-2